MSTATRTLGLTRANARLMTRNRLTLLYGIVLPLLPLAFLFTGSVGSGGSDGSGGGDGDAAGATVVASVLLVAFLFPVYYNVLSLIVTRRDELVLKRLRTGESRDLEILVSISLPGIATAVAVCLLTVAIGAAAGLRLPLNPVLFLVLVLAGSVLFAAFAIWTAAWTRNAEAAQMTSLPVILLAVLGSLGGVLPARFQDVVGWTPGAAVDRLVRITWFGRGDDGALGLAATWGASVQPLVVLVAWTAVAVWLARRSMRWEPRA